MAADALAPYVARTSAAMNIDCVEYAGPGLTGERILGTCVIMVISMQSNDIKCKYRYMIFSLNNLAHKELMCYQGSMWPLRKRFDNLS